MLYNMKLNEWINIPTEIDEATGLLKEEIPDEVTFINVDTRDFHCFLSTEPLKTSVYNHAPEKYHVFVDFLLEIMNDLKEKTGGDGEWRHIELKNGDWLKYIWFIRISKTHFVMCTQNGKTYIDPLELMDSINWDNPYIYTKPE